MSTQANILYDAPRPATRNVSSPISTLQLLSWSVRRELWDNRSLYLAPAIVALLVLLGFFFGPFGLKNMTYVGSTDGAHDHMTLTLPYDLASGLIMVTALLVGVFYSVDALYAERRDRSILFWKSLPVSDLTTVVAKASIPMLLLPLITFVIIVTTHLLMAVSSSMALLRIGDPVAPLWAQLALSRTWLPLLGHLLTAAALWYAPFYAWLFFVSASATRAPLLWAFLPPLAISALETIVFHTSHIGHALVVRLAHSNIVAAATERNAGHRLHLFPVAGLATPELWLGLLTAAVLFAATVQLRRYRSAL